MCVCVWGGGGGEGWDSEVLGEEECCQTWEEGVVGEGEVSGQQNSQPSHLQGHREGGVIQHETEDGGGEY